MSRFVNHLEWENILIGNENYMRARGFFSCSVCLADDWIDVKTKHRAYELRWLINRLTMNFSKSRINRQKIWYILYFQFKFSEMNLNQIEWNEIKCFFYERKKLIIMAFSKRTHKIVLEMRILFPLSVCVYLFKHWAVFLSHLRRNPCDF